MQIEHLETPTAVSLSKPHTNLLKLLRIRLLLVILVLCISGTLLFEFKNLWSNLFPITAFYSTLLTIALISLWLANKAYQNQGYALREHDVVIKKGWLFEKWQIVPLNKIQHTQTTTGPLERWLGLCSVQVFTAGSADAAINGLSNAHGDKVKAWLAAQLPITKAIPPTTEP